MIRLEHRGKLLHLGQNLPLLPLPEILVAFKGVISHVQLMEEEERKS